jgi:predicted membrane protein
MFKSGGIIALLALLLLLLKVVYLGFRSAFATRSSRFANNLSAIGARRFVIATISLITLHLVGRTLSAIYHYGAIAHLSVAHLLQYDVTITLGHFKEGATRRQIYASDFHTFDIAAHEIDNFTRIEVIALTEIDKDKVEYYISLGVAREKDGKLVLNSQGFLISNTIISDVM